MFCIWSHDKEDYILIIGSLFFIFLFVHMTKRASKLVRYIVEENKQLVMYSFKKKKLSTLNLNSDIYYEVLTLIEGTYSKQDFIVLSNLQFESFQKKDAFGLAQICKEVDANGKQIIMPYKNPYIFNLLNVATCHEIN